MTQDMGVLCSKEVYLHAWGSAWLLLGPTNLAGSAGIRSTHHAHRAGPCPECSLMEEGLRQGGGPFHRGKNEALREPRIS